MLDSRATTVRLCLTMGPPLDAQALLRAGVLEGTSIVCAGSRGGPFGEEVARACAALGARVTTWAQGEEAADTHVLCYDGAAAFAAKAGEREALDACLADAWESTRALVAARLLELYGEENAGGRAQDGRGGSAPGDPAGHPSRIIYIAPRARSGAFADAARAGLENLARTLSIEWARYGIRTVAIAPGAEVSAAEVAALVAYLCSPAGGYFSGSLLDLTGPAVSLPN